MGSGLAPRVTTDIKADLQASLAKQQAAAIESVLITGDLSKLSAEQRVSYYNRVCESLGLNPLTKPFAYITLNGKLTLYALKDATEQLRAIHGVSIVELTSQRLEDVFVVTAKASRKDGRTDAATGAVSIGNLKGENLANALMKAETKAKRRATLSICGLGMLDETEAEPLAAAQAPLTVEEHTRIDLPDGTCQILRVDAKSKGAVTWADVTYVTAAGVEAVAAAPGDPRAALVSLCEQLCAERVPVELTTKSGRNGKVVIDTVQRYRPEAVADVVPAEPGAF